MLSRSLRAVLRKESWMFCAGLLLSIADLLDCRLRNCQPPTSDHARGQDQAYSMFPEAFPLPPETRGDNSTGRASSASRRIPADVSTIRRSLPLFNWNFDSNDLS